MMIALALSLLGCSGSAPEGPPAGVPDDAVHEDPGREVDGNSN